MRDFITFATKMVPKRESVDVGKNIHKKRGDLGERSTERPGGGFWRQVALENLVKGVLLTSS